MKKPRIKKQKRKKILALLVSVCMMFQMFSGTVFVAAGSIASTTTYYVGGNNASDGNAGDNSEQPFATLAKAAETINSRGAGIYSIIVQGGTNESEKVQIGDELGSDIDITITSSCTESAQTTSVSGGAIVASVTGSAIILRSPDLTDDLLCVENGATLTLGDSTGTTATLLFFDGGNFIDASTQGAIIRVADNGVLNLYNNVTLHNNNIPNNSGGGIYNTGTFSMYGGTIRNNNAYSGGGIYNEGIIYIFDGRIEQNTVLSQGGGIYNRNTLQISGGSISNNNSDVGGGINNRGTFTMSGGIISENNATSLGGGLFTNSSYDFIMNGGTISTNTAPEGGSVYSYDKIRLSGSASIPEGENQSNNVVLEDNNTFIIYNALSTTERIAVTYGDYKEGKLALEGSAALMNAYRSLFVLTDSRFAINSDGKLIYAALPETFYVGGSGADDANIGTNSLEPFATLEHAFDANKNGKCTIIIQSDLYVSNTIYLWGGEVTIKGDGSTHTVWLNSVDGYSMFYMNNAILNLGDSSNTAEEGTLVLNGNNKNTDCAILNNSYGRINLYSGLVMTNFNVQSVIQNDGILNMLGGAITGNLITQASIINHNHFNMSGGTISDETGIDNFASIVMSDSASVTHIHLRNGQSTLTLGGNLNSTIPFLVTISQYVDGFTVLKGEPDIIEANYGKFVLEDTVNYRIIQDGTIESTVLSEEYYVDGLKGDDSNSGEREAPYKTIQKAAAEIDTNEVGIITLQSDISLTEGIQINGTVSIITDGNSYTISRGPSFADSMINVSGKLILGDKAGSGNDEAPSLIIDGGREGEFSFNDAIVYNQYLLELYPGVVIQNNNSSDKSVGGVYNSGYFHMFGGIIRNNVGSSVGGVYNYGEFVLQGGDICNNSGRTGGVSVNYNSNFTLNGGRVFDNSGSLSGGIYLSNNSIFTMNGGSITQNTAVSNEDDIANASAIYSNTCYSFTMNSGTISDNIDGLSGIVLVNMNLSSDIKKKSKVPDLENSIYTINGGRISNNGGSIPGILVVGNDKLMMSGDPVVTEGDAITFLDSCLSGVEITGSLQGEGKVATIAVTTLDQINATFTPNYPIGMQILYSGSNYSLLNQDLTRFNLADTDYGINSMGKIATGIKESWVAISEDTNLFYNGSGKTVSIVVGDGISTLVRDIDYMVSYRNNINVGTATVIITGNGNYAGSVEKTFTIRQSTPSYAPYIPTAIPKASEETDEINIDMSQKDFSNTTEKVTLPILTEEAFKRIMSKETTDVKVTVKLPEEVLHNDNAAMNLVLEAEVLEAAKDSEKNLTVSIKGADEKELYSWTFQKDEFTTSSKKITDVNLFLKVNDTKDYPAFAENQEEGKDVHGLVISFGHEGVLPCQASVRIYVGDQADITVGSKIYLYHYNKETDKLETLPYGSSYIVDEDGYITMNILHCSDYVLLQEKATSKQITSLRNQITITPTKKTLYLGGNNASTRMELSLPSTMELVNSMKDASSQTAIGRVVATYQSNNEKVATVDKAGKITATGVGQAVITTTTTLYSGKIKNVNTKVTVKKPYLSFTISANSMKVGDAFVFEAIGYGIDSDKIVWTTTKKSILVIDRKTGKAIAKSKGTDYVLGKIGDVSVKLKVVVR